MTKRIAVVPAFNEAPTVERVLTDLYDRVDLLIVVDDGSIDSTRAIIEEWLPPHERAELLVHETNRGMSAAYTTAFKAIAQRMVRDEISAGDIVYTVDADAQHDVGCLEILREHFESERLDALLARRDLSRYPAYKRLGNWVMSAWASLWAGQRLRDVESGYRVFRVGPLIEAQNYYRGYRYSETIELAVVLCRLGHRVSNDFFVPVPRYRSRTRYRDVAIDLVMGPVAARRVATRGRQLARRSITPQQSPA